MTPKWNGHERRKDVPGRRDCDRGECHLHSLVMQTCANDKQKTSEEIKSLFGLAGQMVTWKVFAFITLLAVAVVGAGFGYFGTELKTQGQKHTDAMEKMNTTLSGVAATLTGMGVKIDKLDELHKNEKARE